MFFGNFANIDRRTILMIFGACIIISLLLSGEFAAVLLTLPGVVIAMTFHEFAHAWMANKLGDTTPKAQGRLNLNPVSHIDPFGFLLLLFAHIGWGRPVEINPNNFTSNKSRETCELLVAIAGPIMNFILAFVFMIIYYAVWLYLNISAKWFILTLTIIEYAIYVNIGLGVFNLIPIPPLDGSKIFNRFLPYSAKEWIERNMQIIYIVFLVLWITGLLARLVAPVITLVFKGLNIVVAKIFSWFV